MAKTNTSKSKKSGRMTLEAENYIIDQYASKTIEQLAEETGYTIRGIKSYLKRIGLDKDKIIDNTAKKELFGKPWWQETREQLLDEEVNSFISKYFALMKQFNNDLLPSEENTLVRHIIVQILQARAVKLQTECIRSTRELEGELSLEKNSGGDPSRIADLQRQITDLRNNANLYLKQQNDLSKEAKDLYGSLKANRADRITKIEDASKSFATALQMLEDDEIRQKLSREIQLINIAQTKSKMKLMQPFRFIDGREDLPLLSWESLEFLEEISKENNKDQEGEKHND